VRHKHHSAPRAVCEPHVPHSHTERQARHTGTAFTLARISHTARGDCNAERVQLSVSEEQPEFSASGEVVLSVQVLMGKRDDAASQLCARQLAELLWQQYSVRLPVLVSCAFNEYTREHARELALLVKSLATNA
jgi:hypothetical protein